VLIALSVAVGCREAEDVPLTIQDAATEILHRSGWEGEGILVLGEQHHSVLSPAVAQAAVRAGLVDCMLFELSDHPRPMEERIDRALYRPASGSATSIRGDRFTPLYREMRASSVSAYGVDGMSAEGVHPVDDGYRFLVLDRNDWMAAMIDGAIEAGQCGGAIVLVGCFHLGQAQGGPSSDLALLLEQSGRTVSTVVLADDTIATTREVNLRAWRADPVRDGYLAVVDRRPHWLDGRAESPEFLARDQRCREIYPREERWSPPWQISSSIPAAPSIWNDGK
jgi:hypothetical protein